MYKARVNDGANFTSGIVVATNDPQRRGRIKAMCGSLGDVPGITVDDLPWCRPVSTIGGVADGSTKRGPNGDTTQGSVAYGMWGVPRRGASVVIACMDGDPTNRIWIGCVQPYGSEHTMPHGRYIDGGGPFSSEETPIQPLYRNTQTAFGGDNASPEYASRVADNSVTGITQKMVDRGGHVSSKPDTNTGYTASDDGHEDSHVHSWTTPGFHSVALDDSPQNCRMRFRTTSGHQILMDDTGERIYVSTAEGANWIELDQDGSIDIYAQQSVSIHSARNINFTADQSIRLSAGTSVHIASGADTRLTAGGDLHMLAMGTLRMQSINEVLIEGGASISFKTADDLHIKAGGSFCAKSGGTLQLQAPGVTSSVDIVTTGATSPDAQPAGVQPAMLTNRVPQHEPWPRVGTSHGYTHAPKYSASSDKIGREYKQRNTNWRR